MILILKIGSPPLSEDEVMLYFILCTVHLSYNGYTLRSLWVRSLQFNSNQTLSTIYIMKVEWAKQSNLNPQSSK